MIWRFMGGENLGLFTLAALLIGSGAFSVGAYHAGLRQWAVHWKYLFGAYSLAVVTILVIARGIIALFGGVT